MRAPMRMHHHLRVLIGLPGLLLLRLLVVARQDQIQHRGHDPCQQDCRAPRISPAPYANIKWATHTAC